MEEPADGLFHWTTYHEGIGQKVHSYYLTLVDPPVVIDPRVPKEGLKWFDKRPKPRHIYLTNRHHYRHSDRFAAWFGADVRCHRAGLHEFTQGEAVEPFEHGDTLPGGVVAVAVGVLCPEETALHVPGHVLALGDALVDAGPGRLGFVPDYLLGEDPLAVKQGLCSVFKGLERLEFDHLLLAHGAPRIGNGREALGRFLRHCG